LTLSASTAWEDRFESKGGEGGKSEPRKEKERLREGGGLSTKIRKLIRHANGKVTDTGRETDKHAERV
jgi:hypothetical protein